MNFIKKWFFSQGKSTEKMTWLKELESTKEFVYYLSCLDLSCDLRKASNDMYDELETCDVDMEENAIKNSIELPAWVREKLLGLIDFYYRNADDCINVYSDEERREFLSTLKTRAEEVKPYILQYKV